MAWTPASRSLTLLAFSAAMLVTARAQQATLPPTSPTAAPIAAASPAVAVPATPPEPAQVSFASGKLEVIASGSGLNEILRQAARLTSFTISGRVNDEPVFGTYGPASIGDVLSDLIDGTGTNMLLREPTATRPGELILTPRSGGDFTNANVAPAAYAPPPQTYVRPPYQPPPPQAPGVPQATSPAAPYVPQPPDAGSGAQSPASANSGPPTPEQIYQQLQHVQQSQPHP